MERNSVIGRLTLACALGAATLSTAAVAQTPVYTVKLLPNFSGGTGEGAGAINNAGEAAGGVDGSSGCPATPGGGCAVTWVGSGAPTTLGKVAGSTGSGAIGINNANQVLGYIYTYVVTNLTQPVIWNSGAPTLLPLPTSYTSAYVSHFNDAGEIAGSLTSNTGAVVPTVWNGLTPTMLDISSAFTYGEASGVNNNGLVVGYLCCNNVQKLRSAVVWHGTTPTVLPKLSNQDGSEATLVNNSGLVAGYTSDAALGTGKHGAVWYNGAITVLGSLDNVALSSTVYALNNRGIVVGSSSTTNSGQHATVWPKAANAAVIDLNTLISATAASEIVLQEATGINDSCTIVADGFNRGTNDIISSYELTLTDPSKCVNGGL